MNTCFIDYWIQKSLLVLESLYDSNCKLCYVAFFFVSEVRIVSYMYVPCKSGDVELCQINFPSICLTKRNFLLQTPS